MDYPIYCPICGELTDGGQCCGADQDDDTATTPDVSADDE